jgi:5-methylcytosine-specific restriction enzyme B
MNMPNNLNQRDSVELKLGIKSSLKNVKQVVGLLTALWRVNNNVTDLAYSGEVGTKIVLKPDLMDKLKDYFKNEISASALTESQFINKLDSNPLLKSQIESLKVALELIWKLCIVKFVDESKPFSTERTGGQRFNKKILFTKNIDLLELHVIANEAEIKKILFNWITGDSLPVNTNIENNLVKFFTILSEEAVYRMRINANAEEDIIFHQEGIYSNFSVGDEKVSANDYKENMGSLRILHAIIKENLNYFLKKDGSETALKDIGLKLDLAEYTQRVNNYLDLTNIKLQFVNAPDDNPPEGLSEDEEELPFNWIIFGAPGTGKSFLIESKRSIFSKYERVTFHPSYTYAQFVGTYKPKPIYKEHGASPRYSMFKPTDTNLSTVQSSPEYNDVYTIQNEPYVTYEFVPGPLLRILSSAISDYEKGITNKYLLIIEEINRANVASVFGDVFQLLDRKGNGMSEYKINIPEEMKEYLRTEGINLEQLYFPPNFYIWSTMNSADQGVFPMDTAFKRRWSFEYIDVDNGQEDIEPYRVEIKPFGTINWNSFRRAINKRLTDLEIKEDKLIGPFFISKSDLRDNKRFERSYKSKLLMYLYEDVFKHGRKNEFFKEDAKHYSNALRLYNENKDIFEFSILDFIKELKPIVKTVAIDSETVEESNESNNAGANPILEEGAATNPVENEDAGQNADKDVTTDE